MLLWNEFIGIWRAMRLNYGRRPGLSALYSTVVGHANALGGRSEDLAKWERVVEQERFSAGIGVA